MTNNIVGEDTLSIVGGNPLKVVDLASIAEEKKKKYHATLLEKKQRYEAAKASKQPTQLNPLSSQEEEDLALYQQQTAYMNAYFESRNRNADAWFDNDSLSGQAANKIVGAGAAAADQLGLLVPRATTAIDNAINRRLVSNAEVNQTKQILEKINTNTELTPEENIFTQSKAYNTANKLIEGEARYQQINQLGEEVRSVVNTESTDMASFELKEYNEKALASFKKGTVKDTFKGLGTFLKGLANLAVNNPDAALQYTVESLPYTLSYALAPQVAIPLNSAAITEEVTQAFQEEYGRKPEAGEQALNVAAGILSSSLDALGAKVVLGGKGALRNVFKISKATGTPISKSVTRAAAKAILGVTAGVAENLVVEGGTEAGQELIEQFGAKQDISKIDPLPAMEAGAIGAVSGVVMGTPSDIIQGKRKVSKAATDKKVETYQEEVNTIMPTLPESSEDTGNSIPAKKGLALLKENLSNEKAAKTAKTKYSKIIFNGIFKDTTQTTPKDAQQFLEIIAANDLKKEYSPEAITFLEDLAEKGKSKVTKLAESKLPIAENLTKKGKATGNTLTTVKGLVQTFSRDNKQLDPDQKQEKLFEIKENLLTYEDEVAAMPENTPKEEAKKRKAEKTLAKYNSMYTAIARIGATEDMALIPEEEILDAAKQVSAAEEKLGITAAQLTKDIKALVKGKGDEDTQKRILGSMRTQSLPLKEAQKLQKAKVFKEGTSEKADLDDYVEAINYPEVTWQIQYGRGKGQFAKGILSIRDDLLASFNNKQKTSAKRLITKLASWYNWHSMKADNKEIGVDWLIKQNAKEYQYMAKMLVRAHARYEKVFDEKFEIDPRYLKHRNGKVGINGLQPWHIGDAKPEIKNEIRTPESDSTTSSSKTPTESTKKQQVPKTSPKKESSSDTGTESTSQKTSKPEVKKEASKKEEAPTETGEEVQETGQTLRERVLSKPITISTSGKGVKQNIKYPATLSEIVVPDKKVIPSVVQTVPGFFQKIKASIVTYTDFKWNSFSEQQKKALGSLQIYYNFTDSIINGNDSIIRSINPKNVPDGYKTKEVIDPVTKKKTTVKYTIKHSEFVPYDTDVAIQDVTNYFINENKDGSRYIDSDLLGLISLVAFEWTGTQAESTLFNDDETIMKILGLPEDTSPTSKQRDALRRGTPRTLLERQLGAKVYDLAQWKLNPEYKNNSWIEAKLKVALGQLVLTTLLQAKVLEEKRVNIDQLLGKRRNESTQDFEFLDTKFVTASHTDNFELKPSLVKVQNLFTEGEVDERAGKALKDIFNLDSYKIWPSLKKPKIGLARKIRNTFRIVSKDTNRILDKESQKPWKIAQDMLAFSNQFDDEAQVMIMGGENPNTAHITAADTIANTNKNLRRQFSDLRDFVSTMGSLDQFIYFPYEQWSSGRFGIISNTVDPLASKFHRAVVSKKSWFKTIRLHNRDHYQGFVIGIAQSLGIKVEREFSQIEVDFLKTLEDPKLVKAIGIIQHSKTKGAPKKLSVEDQLYIAEVVKEYGEEYQTLKGLHELSKATQRVTTRSRQLILQKAKEFETDLTIEIDGKTNGIAYSLFQAGFDSDGFTSPKIYKLLNACGILTNYSSYAEYLKQAGNLDIYELVMQGALPAINNKDTRPFYNAFVTFYKEFGSATGKVEPAGRKFVKPSVIQANFGASAETRTQNIIDDTLAKIYAHQASLLNKDSNDPDVIAYNQAIRILTGLQEYMLDTSQANIVKFTDDQLEYLKNVTTTVLAKPIVDSIDNLFSGINTYKDALNKGAKVLFEMFRVRFEALKMDKELDIQKSEGIDRALTKQEIDEIMSKLKDIHPAFIGPHSKTLEDSIYLLTIKKAKKYNPADQNEQRYSGKLENGFESTTSTIPTFHLEDAGIKALILNIHHMDATAQQRMFDDHDVLGIHDAHIGSIIGRKQRGQDYNKYFYEINKDFHGLRNILERIDQVRKFKFTPDEKREINKRIREDKKSFFRDTVYPIVTANASTTNKKGETIPLYRFNHLKDVRDYIDNVLIMSEDARIEILDRTSHYDQYIGQDSSFKNPFNQNPSELSERLEDEFKEMGDIFDKWAKNATKETTNSDDPDGIAASLESFHKTKAKITKEQRESLLNDPEIKNILDSWDILGTTPDPIDTTNFNAVLDEDINALNSQTIFDSLGRRGNVSESMEHKRHLQGVLDDINNRILTPANSFRVRLQEKGNVTRGELHGDTDIYIEAGIGNAANRLQMSSQEVFVHEMVHAVTEEGLKLVPNIRRQLFKLYKLAEKHITAKDLMEVQNGQVQYVVSEADEMKAAEDRLAYIFNSENGLSEFVAYARTNERFRNKLRTISSIAKVEKGTGLLEAIDSIFKTLLDRLMAIFYGTANSNITDSVDKLLFKLNSAKNRRVADMKYEKSLMDKADDKLTSILNNFIFKPINDYNNTTLSKSRNPISRVASTGIEAIALLNSEHFWLLIEEVKERLAFTHNNFLIKLAREIFVGETEDNQRWHSLLRKAKKTIDQARMQKGYIVEEYITKGFHTGLSENTSKSLFRVLMKNDVTSIWNMATGDNKVIYQYTTDEIVNLLSKKDYLEGEISRIVKEMLKNLPTFIAKYIINQAYNLGRYISTGENVIAEEANINAHNIAHLLGVDFKVPKVKNIEQVTQQIDTLATLVGLWHASDQDKFITANKIKAEFAHPDSKDWNGFTRLMDSHNWIKEQSLQKLFNNPVLMAKGYHSVIRNPNTDIQIALRHKEKELAKEGYLIYGGDNPIKLGRDNTLPKTAVDMFLYVTKDNAKNERIRTIFSVTNKIVKGSTVEDWYTAMEDDQAWLSVKQTIPDIRRKNQTALKNQFKQIYDYKTKRGNFLLPVRDDKGGSANYRYVMRHHLLREIFEQDERVEKVFAATESSILDKEASKSINEQLVDAAYDDYMENIAKHPSHFKLVSLDSPDGAKYEELYKLMPEEMKGYIKQKWRGHAGIAIREEFVDLIFGFRKSSLYNAKVFNKELGHTINEYMLKMLDKIEYLFPKIKYRGTLPLKALEDKIQDAVGIAKDLIVVKSGEVLVDNMISNSILLWSKGVPFLDTFKYQKEAFNALDDYHVLLKERDLLEYELNSTRGLSSVRKKNLEGKFQMLNKEMELNPANDLIEKGMFQSIIEDIELKDDLYDSSSKIANFAEKWGEEHLPKMAMSAAKYAWISKDTPLYNLLYKLTQYGDFIARYTLYQHLIKEKGLNKLAKNSEEYTKIEQAILREVVDTFINYDVPTSPQMQYLNDMGIAMFTKFLFRIQRVIFNTFKERPARALSFLLLQHVTGTNPADIYESSFFSGLLYRLGSPLRTILELFQIPILNLRFL